MPETLDQPIPIPDHAQYCVVCKTYHCDTPSRGTPYIAVLDGPANQYMWVA